ncbi:MAG: hypothetical protein LBS50_03630 [Prevotellaceae bacterium]|jgi:hypothetical protein|nr:hypothetical protein [Prevotellaceae bacterium]
MARKFNYIYNKLVSGHDDIVGHIAYSLYKEEKQRYIENFKSKNNNSHLQEADLNHFHEISCLDSALERYQLIASAILQQFLDETLKESVNDIEKECIKNHKLLLQQIIKPIRPSKKSGQFWISLIASFIGTIIFAGFLALLYFILHFNGSDIAKAIS